MASSSNLPQLFSKTADELERAAAHFRESASHTEMEEHGRAGQHAFIAHGHLANAEELAQQAATVEAERFSAEVMEAHPVTEAAADFTSQN